MSYCYTLPGVDLSSQLELPSFSEFASNGQGGRRMLGLHSIAALPHAQTPLHTIHHKEIDVTALSDGWLYSLPKHSEIAVQLTGDQIWTSCENAAWKRPFILPLLRTAIESYSIREGVISLHSACVEIDGQAICFTAPSGTGKSTRAMQWIETLGAKFISGDRPSIRFEADQVFACGVPWDGKEGIYRNIRLPLKMICKIVRSDSVHARLLTKAEAQKLLMQQCFIPMWDHNTAVAAIAIVCKLIEQVPIVELHCGPDAESAQLAYDLIFRHPERIEVR